MSNFKLQNKTLLINVLILVAFFSIGLPKAFSNDKMVLVTFGFHQHSDEYYYKEEQPIVLYVVLYGNDEKEVNIGRNDWYNMLEFSVKPEKIGYKTHEELAVKEDEKERKIVYRVIKEEDLTEGTIGIRERKTAIIEIMDQGDKPFEVNYMYLINAKINYEPSKGSTVPIKIIKPDTPRQYREWHGKMAASEEKKGNYSSAIEHYNELLKIKFERSLTHYERYELLFKLSYLCEKIKKYYKAKKYLADAFDEVREELKELEAIRLEKYERLIAKKGNIMTFEEFNKKEDEIEARSDHRKYFKEAKLMYQKISEKKKELEEYIVKNDIKEDIEEKKEEKLKEQKNEIKLSKFYLLPQDKLTNYYKNVSKKENYTYYQESTIRLKVTLRNPKDKSILLDSKDWFKNLEFSVKPFRHLYSYNSSGEMKKEKGYSKDHEFAVEKSRKVEYKLLRGISATDAKLGPNEEKYAIVDIYDKKSKYFKPGYYYNITVGYKIENKKTLYEWDANIDYDVIEAITFDQKNDWQIRKGDSEVLSGYQLKLAIRDYLKVLEIEQENITIRKVLLKKLSDAYEKDKNYIKAKKYSAELLKYVEEEIKSAEDKTKLEEEKKGVEEKIKMLDEAIKKQGKQK